MFRSDAGEGSPADQAHTIDELRQTNEQLVMAILRTQALDDERQACYAQVISMQGDAVVETDQHLVITAWNQAAVNIYGWTVQEAIDRSRASLLSPGDAAMRTNNPPTGPFEWEESHTHKSGRIIRVAGTTFPLADAFGRVHGYLSVIHDVEARELRQQRETEHRAELQKELDGLKSAFLLTVTHELRGPLNPILGFTRMLLDQSLGKLSQEQEDVLHVVVDSAEHLLSLIDEVLYAARLEAEQVELVVEDFALEDVVLEATTPLLDMAAQRNLKIVVKGTGGTTIVHTDRNRLVHVLTRILRNALNFSKQGDIVVEYHGTESQVVISVSDNGIGVSPDVVGHLFEAFHQASNSIARQYEGLGLGLFTCHKVVELMGGVLAAESSPKNGTTFTFTLPRGPQTKT